MSELNLELYPSYDPNAKGPTVADAVQSEFVKLKAGRTFIPAIAGYKVGYVEKDNATVPESMGSVSDNALVMLTEGLSYLTVDEDDLVYCNFNDTQVGPYASIDIGIQYSTLTLPWDVASSSFSDTVVGAFDLIQGIVGVAISIQITETV